jgi:hypothetical protein
MTNYILTTQVHSIGRPCYDYIDKTIYLGWSHRNPKNPDLVYAWGFKFREDCVFMRSFYEIILCNLNHEVVHHVCHKIGEPFKFDSLIQSPETYHGLDP